MLNLRGLPLLILQIYFSCFDEVVHDRHKLWTVDSFVVDFEGGCGVETLVALLAGVGFVTGFLGLAPRTHFVIQVSGTSGEMLPV